MGALPQALEIIFKVQRKKNNEKIKEENKLSNLQNVFFFFFLLFKPLLFLNIRTFLFFIHFK
jgi:hypothetical protein